MNLESLPTRRLLLMLVSREIRTVEYRARNVLGYTDHTDEWLVVELAEELERRIHSGGGSSNQ